MIAKMALREITPEQASAWLENNVAHNRPITWKTVKLFEEEMKAGKWKYNGETIKIDRNGNVIDGQHRLWACVLANVPFTSLVVFDLDSEVFDTIDRGHTRSPGNVFAIAGITNANLVAAGMAIIYAYQKTKTCDASNVRTSAQHLLALHKDWPEVDEAAHFAAGHSFSCKLMPPRVLVGTMAIMLRLDENLARAFWSDFNDQTNIFQQVTKLREKLLGLKVARTKPPVLDVAALVVKTWNFVRRGEQISRLQWVSSGANKENFPPFR